VLCYHSQILSGNDYAGNGHVALAADLETLHTAGVRIVPAARVAAWLRDEHCWPDAAPRVALTFDDGSLLDFADVEHPGFGRQRGFVGILDDFRARHGAAAQPQLHATSFVIASDEARAQMDRNCLYGLGWMGSEWWREAEAGGLLEIGNHSWNHNNPACAERDDDRGRFDHVADAEACRRQVADAGRAIAAITGRRSRLFAYPYGDPSEYLRKRYLPERPDEHGLCAAFDTRGRPVKRNDSPWAIPRLVHGADWRSPAQFESLLAELCAAAD